MNFSLEEIEDNANGFGPSNLPKILNSLPFAPYSKSDRIGKIADFCAPQSSQEDGHRKRHHRNTEAFGTGSALTFMYQHAAEDEATFSIVDRASTVRKPFGKSQRKTGPFKRDTLDKKGMPIQRRRFGLEKPARIREASIAISNDWTLLEEVDFSSLAKLNFEVDEPVDIETFNNLNYYDSKVFDRVSIKSDKPLIHTDKVFFSLPTLHDPILMKYANKEDSGTTVFATDSVLSTLMASIKSVYSWDITILKENNKVYLDYRESGNFEYLSVNENAAEPPMESPDENNPNTPVSLSYEATKINKSFSQQSQVFESPQQHPSQDSDSASQAYRYRKWNIGSENSEITLIARTHLDAAISSPSGTLLVTVKALNEFDSRSPGSGGAPDWRQKLDSQRGAVMASEIKNNSNKLSKWAVESILSGSDLIKIGFVGRVIPKDKNRHQILGISQFKPREFAGQINLDLGNCWGIVRAIVDLVLKQEDGKYLLFKDPNKACLKLFAVGDDLEAIEEEDDV